MAIDNVFVPKQGSLSDLRSWIAGELGASRIRLYTNAVVYSPDSVSADFTEATFAGYAPFGPVAWSAPFINGVSKGETDSQVLTWTFTSLVGTALIRGIYVTDALKSVLLAVIPFQAPITLTPAAPTLTRVVQMTAVSEL